MSTELTIQQPATLGFLPTTMEQALEFSAQMSKAKLLPAHLQSSPADCLRVVMQAARWQMDPFAVADKTSVISGKMMYEGQLVSAVVNARGNLAKRLNYTYAGEGNARVLTVTGTLKGEDEPRVITLSFTQARQINKNGQMDKNPDQQASYIGARIWARRHMPELMLGVYADDEVTDEPEAERNVTEPAERPAAPTRRGGPKAATESATHPATVVSEPAASEKPKAEKPADAIIDAEFTESERSTTIAATEAKAKADAEKAAAEAAKKTPAKIDTSKVPEVVEGVSYAGFKGKAWPVLITATINAVKTVEGATPHHKVNVTTHNPAEATFDVVIFRKAGEPTPEFIAAGKTIEFNAKATLYPLPTKDATTKEPILANIGPDGKPLPNLAKAPAIIASDVTETTVEPSF